MCVTSRDPGSLSPRGHREVQTRARARSSNDPYTHTRVIIIIIIYTRAKRRQQRRDVFFFFFLPVFNKCNTDGCRALRFRYGETCKQYPRKNIYIFTSCSWSASSSHVCFSTRKTCAVFLTSYYNRRTAARSATVYNTQPPARVKDLWAF